MARPQVLAEFLASVQRAGVAKTVSIDLLEFHKADRKQKTKERALRLADTGKETESLS